MCDFFDMGDWTIIEAPTGLGTDRRGSAAAPEWLMLNSRLVGEVRRIDVSDLRHVGFVSNGVRDYANVLAFNERLREEVVWLMSKGKRVLTIGGDHSIALGSISGVLELNGNVGVIWFDAHGDINTEATSPSANAHGMPVAALMGLCKSGINDIATTHLKPQNIFWVGARDLDPGELGTIKQLGILDNVYSTERVHEFGMDAVMEDIKRKMEAQGVEAIHLSFDVDGMDPSIVWATGTRVENGLMSKDLEAFIEGLHKLPEMKSMDFVEYNPLLDDEEKTTGKWCVETLIHLVEKLRVYS